MNVLVVAIAGSVGAVFRFGATRFVQERTESSLPFGTAVVNLFGAFLLGLVVGADSLPEGLGTVSAGFLGGFTTFSTWMVDTTRLGVVPRLSLTAALNIALLTGLGVATAGAGFMLTS